MKHCVDLPHHEVLEPTTALFEVNAKVVHNRDVISDLFGSGEVGEPATSLTFREVNPTTRWGRCSHGVGGVSEGKGKSSWGWGGRGRDVR